MISRASRTENSAGVEFPLRGMLEWRSLGAPRSWELTIGDMARSRAEFLPWPTFPPGGGEQTACLKMGIVWY
jgi:hypothetical protein